MTRDESKMMQGVAILMMIFFHLFTPSLVPEYKGTMIGAWAQVQNPVPLYTLLSGYGLYCVYRRGTKDNHRYSRCLRLYVRYWLITGCFVLLYAGFVKWGGYKWADILLNATGLQTDINPTTWFVLPYCILALAYPLLFKLLDKVGSVVGLIVAYGIYVMMAYAIGHFGKIFSTNILQVFYIFFPFILGAVMSKVNMIEKVKEYAFHLPWGMVWLVFILWLVIRFFVVTGAFASFYAMGLTVLIVCGRRPQWLTKLLLTLGRQSVGMWFVHWWIFWQLGRDYVCGLKSPILIMLAVTIVSFLLAIVFDRIYELMFGL